jgi:hypothetical protein
MMAAMAGLAFWIVPASRGSAGPLEWKGMDAALREPMDIAVEDPGTWRRLWRRAFGKDAPGMDFDRYFVVCVFLGNHADWYYAISFEDPVARGSEYVVGYGLTMLRGELAPRSESIVDVGIPGQYAMKAFPIRAGLKPALRMVFKDDEAGKERRKSVR